MNFTWYLRRDANRKDGRGPLYLLATINGHPEKFKTDLLLHPSHWNSRTQKLTAKCPNYLELSELIRREKDRHEKAYFDLRLAGLPITKEAILKRLQYGQQALFAEVAHDINRGKKDLADNTQNTRSIYLKNLSAIFARLTLDDINAQFEVRFFDEMERQGYKPATANQHAAYINAVLNDAKKKGLTNNPYRLGKTKAESKPKKPFTLSEVQRLIGALDNPPPGQLGHWLITFVLQVLTGSRFGELRQLKEAEPKTANGREYLMIVQGKSGKKKTIPLNPLTKKLWEQFEIPKHTFTYNKQIRKVLMIVLDITADEAAEYSNHCSRATLAELVLNEGGGTYDEAANLLGNTAAVVRKHYGEIRPETTGKISDTVMGKLQ